VLCWQTDAIPQATPNLMTPNLPNQNGERIRDGDAFVTMEDGLEISYLLSPLSLGPLSRAMRVRWFIATTAKEPRRDAA
jgi:hypothetical protein